MLQNTTLALTDHDVLPISTVLDAVRRLHNAGADQCDPLIITQASSLSNFIVLFILNLSLHSFTGFHIHIYS